ncbi:protein of unknown function [Pararobbsia alpina]
MLYVTTKSAARCRFPGSHGPIWPRVAMRCPVSRQSTRLIALISADGPETTVQLHWEPFNETHAVQRNAAGGIARCNRRRSETDRHRHRNRRA